MAVTLLNPQKTDTLVMRFQREPLMMLIGILNAAQARTPDGDLMEFMIQEEPHPGNFEINAQILCKITHEVKPATVADAGEEVS